MHAEKMARFYHPVTFRFAERVAEYGESVEHEAIVNEAKAGAPTFDDVKSEQKVFDFIGL